MIVFRIKFWRNYRNVSIRKLAEKSGVSRSYIEDLENGKKFNPTLDKLYSIAAALDVNIKDLFYTKFDIDTLREEMYKKIHEFGVDSTEALEISQLIDLLININMQERKKDEDTN